MGKIKFAVLRKYLKQMNKRWVNSVKAQCRRHTFCELFITNQTVNMIGNENKSAAKNHILTSKM